MDVYPWSNYCLKEAQWARRRPVNHSARLLPLQQWLINNGDSVVIFICAVDLRCVVTPCESLLSYRDMWCRAGFTQSSVSPHSKVSHRQKTDEAFWEGGRGFPLHHLQRQQAIQERDVRHHHRDADRSGRNGKLWELQTNKLCRTCRCLLLEPRLYLQINQNPFLCFFYILGLPFYFLPISFPLLLIPFPFSLIILPVPFPLPYISFSFPSPDILFPFLFAFSTPFPF